MRRHFGGDGRTSTWGVRGRQLSSHPWVFWLASRGGLAPPVERLQLLPLTIDVMSNEPRRVIPSVS